MALAYLGDDAPIIDVPASVDEPEPEVQPELIQPNSPVLHPKPSPRKPAPAIYTLPTTVHASSPKSGFPWWLVVVLLIAADGKKR